MTARSFNDDQLAGATRCGSWESASTPEILMLRRSKTGARLTDLERIYSVYNFILFYTPIPKHPAKMAHLETIMWVYRQLGFPVDFTSTLVRHGFRQALSCLVYVNSASICDDHPPG
jgi:hypothetical protein